MQSLATEHQSAQLAVQQKIQELQVREVLQFIYCVLVQRCLSSRLRLQGAVDAAEKRATSLSLELKQLQAIIRHWHS
jgi:hypothetical protein